MERCCEQTRTGKNNWRRLADQSFDLRAMFAEVGVQMALQARTRGLFLDLHITPETPRYFLGGDYLCRALLIITVAHCLRTIDQGGVTILIQSTPLNTDGLHRLEIVVTDTGSGAMQRDDKTDLEDREAMWNENLVTIERFVRQLDGTVRISCLRVGDQV